MEITEKKARIANLISLAFCFAAIYANLFSGLNILVLILACLQLVHLFFGDVTDSYRLLKKKMFLKGYTAVLAVFSALNILSIIFLELRMKIYLLSILIAFAGDFAANKLRVRKLNKKDKTKK